jgi:tetratricopeptide (TPR) repeat protein
VRYALLAAAFIACAFASAPVDAQTLDQRQVELCNDDSQGGTPPQQGIAACTALLDSGQVPASAIALLHTKRGRFYLFAGDYGRAIADFDQAIARDPTDETSYFNRGRAKYQTSDNDGAIADISEAMRRGLKAGDVFGLRGMVYSTKGDFSLALADLNEAIRLSPPSAYLYWGRGDAYQHLNDLNRAIADYDKSISLDSKTGVYHFSRGLAKLDQDDPAAALTDFNSAVELEPNEAVYRYARGLAAQKLGRAAEAQTDIAKATAQDANVEKSFAAVASGARPPQKSASTAAPTTPGASPPATPAPVSGSAQSGPAQSSAAQPAAPQPAAQAPFDLQAMIAPFQGYLIPGGIGLGAVLLLVVAFVIGRATGGKKGKASEQAGSDSQAKPRRKGRPLIAIGSFIALAVAAGIGFVVWQNMKKPDAAAPAETASAPTSQDLCTSTPDDTASIDKRIAACTDIITSGLVRGPELAEFYTHRGLLKVGGETKDRAGAIADYTQAIKLDPQNPDGYEYRAGSLIMLKDYDAAVADANTAIKLTDMTRETAWSPIVTLGKAYFSKGDYKNAITTFNQVIAVSEKLESMKDVGQAQGFFGRGLAEIRLGRKQDGEADIAKARMLFDPVDNLFVAYGMTAPDKPSAPAPAKPAAATPAATTPAAPAPAAAKPAPAAPTGGHQQSTTPTPAPAPAASSGPEGFLSLTNVDQSFNPDWRGFRADGEAPTIYILRKTKPSPSLSILVMTCDKYTDERDTPDCKAGRTPTEYKVTTTSETGKSDITDCPEVNRVESCEPLWRSQGADIIALARAMKAGER